MDDERNIEAHDSRTGIIGDHAQVGEMHFHLHTSPAGIPLQRPPRAEHFTDRTQELQRLLDDLRPGQVATLCGPGGIGKTALAAEAIWKLAPENEPPERFPDGILFHSFYGQPDPGLALEHIVTSFGTEPKPSPATAALQVLAGKHALLILDGAEDAADLQAVLDVRGGCGVLVTSRTRKDAVAECQDIEPLELKDAVALLRKWSGDRATDDRAAARICRLTGYLPLAVRLAGRFLDETGETAVEYLDWLEETPLEALSHGDWRTESVDVLLEKSLEQLSEDACCMLGVVGLLSLTPFDRDPIAAALDLSIHRLHKPLGELVSYGLLSRNGERYEVSHALVHTYARKRVEPETEALTRLAAYYNALAREQQERGLPGYLRLDVERGHIMRVLRTCAEREKWDAVDRLAWVLTGKGSFLRMQGYWTNLMTATKIGLTAARNLNNQLNEEAFLIMLGLAYVGLGKAEQAIGFYEKALVICHKIDHRQDESNALGDLGNAYSALGQVKKAIDYYEQALAIAREIGHQQNEGSWLGNLGNAYSTLGEVEKAIEYYEQALAIACEIGCRQNEGSWLGNLGNAYSTLGEVERAIDYYEQALTTARDIGHRQNEGSWLGSLGNAYSALGQLEKAIEYYEQVLAIAREIGYRQMEGNALGNLGSAYSALGQVEKAIDYYEQALAIAREIGYRQGECNHLGNLGIAYSRLGQVKKAIEYSEQALAIDREIGYRQGEGADLGNLGNAYRALGQVEQAIDYYEQALAIAREIGHRQGEGAHLGNLGLAYRDLEQVQKARKCLEQSLAISEEIKSPNVDLVRRWLGELEGGEKQ